MPSTSRGMPHRDTRNAIDSTRNATPRHAECPAKLRSPVDHVDKLRECFDAGTMSKVFGRRNGIPRGSATYWL